MFLKADNLIWNVWSIALNIIAIIISFTMLPPGKTRMIVMGIFLITLVILICYTATQKLKNIGIWYIVRRKFGIRGIYDSGVARDMEMKNHILKAHELKIMAISASNFIYRYQNEMVDALINNNCVIKVLLAEEDSTFTKEIEKAEGSEVDISEEIKRAKRLLKEIIRNAENKARKSKRELEGSIFLEQFDTLFRAAFVICDDSWGWCSLNFPPIRSRDSISLELQSTDSSGRGLLELLKEHFDRVWDIYRDRRKKILPD